MFNRDSYKDMELPKDPNMLMSFVNMKLRDEGCDLDSFCDDNCIDREVLVMILKKAGFEYDPAVRRFY